MSCCRNAYRVIVAPMTSEMMNLVKNSAIASTPSVWWIWRRRQANCWITRHACLESFTAITLAYVLINAVIMLVMSPVERKVRLPGNVGSNNVQFTWSSIIPSLPYLLAGLVITLKITVTAVVVGIGWAPFWPSCASRALPLSPGLLERMLTFSVPSRW